MLGGHAEMVVATRAGAEQEKQPGGLQVFEVWKALEQEVVLVPGVLKLLELVCVTADRGS